MARLAPLAVAGTILALVPGTAVAGGVPGAHYTGTTDQNYPISFDVAADGTSLTNVVTTTNAFCTGGQPAQTNSTNSTFAFPISGNSISGEDPDKFPYLKMSGTFSSPEQASGTLSTSSGGFANGFAYFCNALDREWSASTSSSGGGGSNGGGGDSGGGGDTGGGGGSTGGGAAGGPVITFSFPSGVLLRPSLKNGFVVGVAVDRPSRISGRLVLGKRDAKKYKLGKRAVVVSRSTESNGGPESGLEFRFKKSVAKKLGKAKKLKFVLEVTVVSTADGSTSSGTRTLSLR